MQKNMLDEVVDGIKERLEGITKIIHEENKDVASFGYKPVPTREALYYYLNLTDEQKQFGRQSFGTAYNVYEQKMEKLREKYNG